MRKTISRISPQPQPLQEAPRPNPKRRCSQSKSTSSINNLNNPVKHPCLRFTACSPVVSVVYHKYIRKGAEKVALSPPGIYPSRWGSAPGVVNGLISIGFPERIFSGRRGKGGFHTGDSWVGIMYTGGGAVRAPAGWERNAPLFFLQAERGGWWRMKLFQLVLVA